MAERKYRSLTHEERKAIQKMWEDGKTVKEIAGELQAPVRTVYSELVRGRPTACPRLSNQRIVYDAELAQLRLQRSFEARGRKAADDGDGSEENERAD